MYPIKEKRVLNPSVTLMRVYAPLIAAKAQAGQFIILRVNETGERIPLTVADTDTAEGTVTIIYQKVGVTTWLLDTLEVGDNILDFTGPLGRAAELEGVQRAIVVGGGLGCAIAYPEAKALFQAGAHVEVIAGFRNADLVILEQELKAISTSMHLMTDDGSAGEHGFVTQKLAQLLESGSYDLVIAIGPLPMMRAVAGVTLPFGVRTLVSMNPIMIDGTGMCGGCRLTVGGETRFACVDGPEFDAHAIDWEESMRRLGQYREHEQACYLLHKGEIV